MYNKNNYINIEIEKAKKGVLMKYLKITLLAFAVTLILSTISIDAYGNSHGYNGVDLPALQGKVKRGPQTKTENNYQYYENTGTINKCTGNENGVRVRVYSEANGYSSYITLSNKGNSGTWGNNSKTTAIGAYDLNLKNNTSSPCGATHSGIWYLDKSIYNATH